MTKFVRTSADRHNLFVADLVLAIGGMVMSDETPPLLEEDYVAAREVVDKYASEQMTKPTAKQIEYYARQRARLGSRLFRILHGLEPPRHDFERLTMKYRTGKISHDQLRDRWQQCENQPVEDSTLRAYFNDFDERVGWYDRLVQLALEPVKPEEADTKITHAKRFIFEIQRNLSLPRRQLQIIMEFSEEARVEHGLGLARIGPRTACSASELLIDVTNFVVSVWQSIDESVHENPTHSKYSDVIQTFKRFFTDIAPPFPSPTSLQALLKEEHALCRRALKQSNNPADDKPQIINKVHFNPNIDVAPQIDLHVEMPDSDQSGTRTKGSNLSTQQREPRRKTGNASKLKDWAVGIEHDKCWWLFQRKSRVWQQWKKVAIPGGNPSDLMEVLAEGGGQMSKAEARRKMQPKYPDADGKKISRVITEALKKARKAIREAIAEVAGRTYQEVSDPIPHEIGGWRAEIEIGYATLDADRGKMIFKLKEEMH